MQNEERINVLETQVRTVRKIVCLVCCLFVFAMIVGCQSRQTLVLPQPLADFLGTPLDYDESGEWNHNEQIDR
jgi:hypothetical protein